MKRSGIYKIVNLVNQKYYVGSTENFDNRKQRHFRYLRAGTHINDHLQSAWNKYGESNFEFVEVELVPRLKLLEQEQLYLNEAFRLGNQYNIAKSSTAPMSGLTLTDAQKQKIGNTHRGKIVSKKTRQLISKARSGTKLSEEHKQSIRDSCRKISVEDMKNLIVDLQKPIVTIASLMKEFNRDYSNTYWVAIGTRKSKTAEDRQIRLAYKDRRPTIRQLSFKYKIGWRVINKIRKEQML